MNRLIPECIITFGRELDGTGVCQFGRSHGGCPFKKFGPPKGNSISSSSVLRDARRAPRELDGLFYNFTACYSLSCEARGQDAVFPRNLVCIRGVLYHVSVFRSWSPATLAIESIIIPRALLRLSVRVALLLRSARFDIPAIYCI
jgi:hypothetical protein